MSTLKAPPLTEPQRKRLVCLIARESVIHNKSQHNANLARKKRAWHDIAFTFNAAYPSREHRTPRQLKRSWEHIKRRVRQEHSEYNRKKLKLPEGGPPPSPPKLSEAMVAAVPLMGRDLAHDSIDLQLDDDESDPLSHTVVGEESLPSPPKGSEATMAAIAQMGRDLALDSLGLQAGVEEKDQELQTKTENVDDLQAGTSTPSSSPPALTSYNIAPPSSQTFSSANSLLQTILSSPSSQHSNSTSLPPISSAVSETHFPSLFFPPASSAVTLTSPSSVIPPALLPTNSTSSFPPHLILLSSLSRTAPSLASDKTILPSCTPPTCTTPTSATLVSSPSGATRSTGCRKTTDELFNQVRQRQDESHNRRMQQIQEEHEALMQQRKEEHEARMKHMEEEMRWKEEEHKAKMQLMQSSKNSIQEAFAPLIDFLNTGKLAYASMATAYKKIAESVLRGNEDT